MKKETKLIVGISLVVSAITTTIAFISLCIKKKNAWEALLALAAAEGLVGIALIEDKMPKAIHINRPKKVTVPDEEIVFGETVIDETVIEDEHPIDEGLENEASEDALAHTEPKENSL